MGHYRRSIPNLDFLQERRSRRLFKIDFTNELDTGAGLRKNSSACRSEGRWRVSAATLFLNWLGHSWRHFPDNTGTSIPVEAAAHTLWRQKFLKSG